MKNASQQGSATATTLTCFMLVSCGNTGGISREGTTQPIPPAVHLVTPEQGLRLLALDLEEARRAYFTLITKIERSLDSRDSQFVMQNFADILSNDLLGPITSQLSSLAANRVMESIPGKLHPLTIANLSRSNLLSATIEVFGALATTHQRIGLITDTYAQRKILEVNLIVVKQLLPEYTLLQKHALAIADLGDQARSNFSEVEETQAIISEELERFRERVNSLETIIP